MRDAAGTEIPVRLNDTIVLDDPTTGAFMRRFHRSMQGFPSNRLPARALSLAPSYRKLQAIGDTGEGRSKDNGNQAQRLTAVGQGTRGLFHGIGARRSTLQPTRAVPRRRRPGHV